jgi:hypothetical protein
LCKNDTIKRIRNVVETLSMDLYENYHHKKVEGSSEGRLKLKNFVAMTLERNHTATRKPVLLEVLENM